MPRAPFPALLLAASLAAASVAPLARSAVAAPARVGGKGPLARGVQPAATLSVAEQAVAARVDAAAILGHARFLADDLLEGRLPGTRGSALAVRYLAAQLEALGLRGGHRGEGASPSFLQPVPLVSLEAKVPEALIFSPLAGGPPLSLAATGGVKAELVIEPDAHLESARLGSAEVVFAGHGIVAPEYGWDDYAGADVRGKLVVMLNSNPPFAGEVGGRRVRLWYGRWDYKFLTAAAHGAAGALVVHTTETSGYPWQVLAASADGRVQDLPPAPGEPRLQLRGFIDQPAARRLAALGGADLDRLTAAAQERGFRAASLGVRTSVELPVALRRIESANVVGVLPGSDPALAGEAVVYTAHHDHLGSAPPVPPATDGIYNGAVDNASGCATVLAIAAALAPTRPRRSIYFVFTTAEEQGLLGARWFARHLPVPAGRIAAGINLESVNIWGLTEDLGLLGLGKSSLDAEVTALARAQGRSVHGDAFPDRGSFYRSDQFELARVGVPVASLKGGPRYAGRPAGWGEAQEEAWEARDYHQVSDEVRAEWNLEGAVQDARLQALLGLRVANAEALPRWTPGDEFEAARRAAPR